MLEGAKCEAEQSNVEFLILKKAGLKFYILRELGTVDILQKGLRKKLVMIWRVFVVALWKRLNMERRAKGNHVIIVNDSYYVRESEVVSEP